MYPTKKQLKLSTALRRFNQILTCCMCCLVLTGCFEVNWRIELRNDGSGTFTGTFITSPLYAQALSDSLKKDAAKTGTTFREFIRNGKYYISETFDFNSLSSLEQRLNSLDPGGGINSFVVKTERDGEWSVEHLILVGEAKQDPVLGIIGAVAFHDKMARYELVAPKGTVNPTFARLGGLEIEASRTENGAVWEIPMETLFAHAYENFVVSFKTTIPLPVSGEQNCTPVPLIAGTGNTTSRLCEAALYAKLASWAYSIKRTGESWCEPDSLPDSWNLVDSFVDAKLSHGLVGDHKVVIGTGLKAGLFRNHKTNDLAIFFAGTEVENDHSAEIAELFNFTAIEWASLCVAHLQTCAELFSEFREVYLDYQRGQPLYIALQNLARVDPNVILSEPALADKVYAAFGFAFGEPDVNSDVNIAYPVLSPITKSMFDLAGRLYDDWGKADKFTALLGSPASRRIVMVGGHSLGGSVAQVVGLSKNVPAITFNSAPVPLDPHYRNVINYDPNRNNILNVRSSDDPVTGIVFSLQSNNELRSFLTTLIEGIYLQRSRLQSLGDYLKQRYEAVINDNNFYAGKENWLNVDAETGHDIDPLAKSLMTSCQNYPSTLGQVRSELP